LTAEGRDLIMKFHGKGIFTLTLVLSNKRKGSVTLTPTLSPQGRGK
jgi:hypothetical protein